MKAGGSGRQQTEMGVARSRMPPRADKSTRSNACLAAGADLGAKDEDGNTALGHAAMAGKKAEFEALIKAGADETVRNKHGHTLLMLAAARGHADIVDAVLARAADIDAKGARWRDRLEPGREGLSRRAGSRSARQGGETGGRSR